MVEVRLRSTFREITEGEVDCIEDSVNIQLPSLTIFFGHNYSTNIILLRGWIIKAGNRVDEYKYWYFS